MRTLLASGFIVFLIVATVLVMISMAPASWVAHAVAHISKSRVLMAHPRGWWHDGAALLMLASGSGGAEATYWPQRISWRVRPVDGLTAVRVTAHVPDAGPPIEATLSLWPPGSRLSGRIGPWRGHLPLTALAGLGAPFNTLNLQGEAQIDLTQVQIPPAQYQPRAAPHDVLVTVHGLRSALAQGVELGDYVLNGSLARHEQDNQLPLAFNLHTLRGALNLSGNGRCQVRGQVLCNFAGKAYARGQDEALLGNLIGLLGKTQAAPQPSAGAAPARAVTELRW